MLLFELFVAEDVGGAWEQLSAGVSSARECGRVLASEQERAGASRSEQELETDTGEGETGDRGERQDSETRGAESRTEWSDCGHGRSDRGYAKEKMPRG
jgi:hypothetical protein